jgi:hypothetical protein
VSRRLLVPAALLLAGLSACGSDALSAAQVAASAEQALEEETGVRPHITCPKELAAEVGAHTRCTLTAGGDPTRYGVTVTVLSVDGDTPDLQVQVDEEPAGRRR